VNVLVVDTDPVSRGLVRDVVIARGHRCEVASDGDAAWAAYLRRGADLVFCAPNLSGLSGWDLLQWVREESGDRAHFVVLVDPEEGDRRETAVELGADDYLPKPLNAEDLGFRIRVAERIHALRVRVIEQARALEEARLRLSDDASTDPLTGAGSAAQLARDLSDLSARVERYGNSCVLALVEIDRLASCGAVDRDRALRAVGAALVSRCRAGDRVYRRGDDRFLVTLPEQGLQEGSIALDRLRRTIDYLQFPRTEGLGDQVTVSAGLSRLQREPGEGGGGADEALARAGDALTSARVMGGNRVCIYESMRFASVVNLAAR